MNINKYDDDRWFIKKNITNGNVKNDPDWVEIHVCTKKTKNIKNAPDVIR